MVPDYGEYKKEWMDDIHLSSQIDGKTPDSSFFDDVLERLSSQGEIIDPIVKSVRKNCSKNRIMAFDAYAYDEYDKSFVLITNVYNEEEKTLTNSDINTISQRMINFISECYEGKIQNFFDITDNLIKVGEDLGKRLKIDYQSTSVESIDKIKLYIVTNNELSSRVKNLAQDDLFNVPVQLNVWNCKRFYELYLQGKSSESVTIETYKYGCSGIPCMKANTIGNIDYDAYMCIVPGDFLYRIYAEHGSRLLEGNVRAFLSNKGKVNKGIRLTIKNEPTKFFIYNNGIACTAASIKLNEKENEILEFDDLQIINGGQTTASLHSAVVIDKNNLENIFVPMKLTVIKNDDYETMIQNISKYANSQNKVKNSDLFSNHIFHRNFEALSRKIQAPMKSGDLNNTLWYYERSRGKYQQELFRQNSKAEKDAFLRKYPKNQVIKKEELAKYYTAAVLLRPDIVSKGSENCLSFFAEEIDKMMERKESSINDQFFRNCICYTILYRDYDKIVQKAEWYTKGGPKYNIVPYTISKLVSALPKGYTIDYDRIWKEQKLYLSLEKELYRLGKIVNDFVYNSEGKIVGEYCKKEDTWKKFLSEKYELSEEFVNDLLPISFMKDKEKSEEKDVRINKNINIEMEIFQRGGLYWKNLLDEGIKRDILSEFEKDLLNIAAKLGTPNARIPSPKQCKFIWKIREKLEKEGVLVD